MPLPPAIDALWRDMEAVRDQILKEVDGLSQAQFDWRAGAGDWAIGEIVHHLTLAEVATGKLTSKLLKEAGPAAAPFPTDLRAFSPVPAGPPGPAEAPPMVRPESGGRADELVAAMRAARERSRQSIERLAEVDPRPLRWSHARFGEMDLGQWWMLQAHHDADHLQQLRAVKAAPGFPRA